MCLVKGFKKNQSDDKDSEGMMYLQYSAGHNLYENEHAALPDITDPSV